MFEGSAGDALVDSSALLVVGAAPSALESARALVDLRGVSLRSNDDMETRGRRLRRSWTEVLATTFMPQKGARSDRPSPGLVWLL